MRKLAFVALSVATVAGLTGCAATDYCDSNECAARVSRLGTTDLAIGCTDSAINPGQGDVAQRPFPLAPGGGGGPASGAVGGGSFVTTQAWVDEALLMNRCANDAVNACLSDATAGGCTVTEAVSTLEAESWMRELGAYSYGSETYVIGGIQDPTPGAPVCGGAGGPGCYDGVWYMAGVKALGYVCDPNVGHPVGGGPAGGGSGSANSGAGGATIAYCNPADGFCTIRLATFSRYTPSDDNAAQGSCGAEFTEVDGQWGGPEAQIYGESLAGGRLEGLQIETIALDSAPGNQFAPNIRAIRPESVAGGVPYMNFTFSTGRYREGRLFLVPVHGAEGLAQFLSGGSMTMSLPNLPATVTARGNVGNDGKIEFSIDKVTWQGIELALSRPLVIKASRDFRSVMVGSTSHPSWVPLHELAIFALRNMDLSQPINFSGVIPELGLELPGIGMKLSRTGIERYAYNSGVGTGDRGRSR